MHEDFPPAHKLILASVSPVFRFYGSIPVGEVVDIKEFVRKLNPFRKKK